MHLSFPVFRKIAPTPQNKREAQVHCSGKTSVGEFLFYFSNGCLSHSWIYCQVVTIYATLGEEGAVHGINETGAATVVAETQRHNIK